MSKIFSKLNVLPMQKIAAAIKPTETPVQIVKAREVSIFIILGILLSMALAFYLGRLSSNTERIKKNILLSLNANIQRQQDQILVMNKKFIALQSSLDGRFNTVENKTIDIKNTVDSRLLQGSVNMDRMEAILQANIDELNTKFNKLQMDIQASPKTGDQT